MCRLCSLHDVVSGKIFLLRNQDFLPRSLHSGLTSSRFAFKLEADRLSLREKLKDNLKDAEIRLKLRKNDGHKGKVNTKVLNWIDHAEELHLKTMSQLGDIYVYELLCCCRYLHLKIDRNLLKLIQEVDILLEDASSLIIYEPVAIQSQTDFVHNLAPKVLEELWDSLMDPTIGIIGLYGNGGVGKTTIMKNIADQLALTNTETFENVIWVSLSANVNWERVRDDIAMQLSIDLPELLNFSLGVKNMEMEKRKLERGVIMSKYLRNVKRCLFIFDDMWKPTRPYAFNDDMWTSYPPYNYDDFDQDFEDALEEKYRCTIPESFRHTIFPDPTEDNGCKVVITTRDQSVCEEMGAYKQIYLAPLSEKEAWDLFVTRCGDHVLDPVIQSISREVADECGGLPLNISAIAHAMRGESNAAAWKLALMDMRIFSQEMGMTHDKLYHLRFCYNRLKNDQIRKCFLYCGVFPENYKFKSKELIEYWMAEDYIYIEGDRVGSIDMGKHILRELKDANMLEMFEEDGNECFKMHGLFRDLAVSIAGNEYNFKVEAGLKLKYFPDSYTEQKRHAELVSVIRNDIQTFLWDGKYPSLSTLLFKDNPLAHISSGYFHGFPNLEFLDMSYTGITELPSSLCDLTRLRVLFLGYCTSLKKIPSLGKLKELQVLNLSGTLIKELPEGMKCLAKLRSLDISETVRLEDIQDGVLSSLSNLEELHMQGSRICRSDSPTVALRLNEIRCLKKLSILTLSAVGFGDHLDTILYLQGFSLKVYSLNSYGTSQDYVEDI